MRVHPESEIVIKSILCTCSVQEKGRKKGMKEGREEGRERGWGGQSGLGGQKD